MALYLGGDYLYYVVWFGLQVTMTRFGSIRVDERKGEGGERGVDERS